MAGKGLYANIHAKRKRGGKMRKKGAKDLGKADRMMAKKGSIPPQLKKFVMAKKKKAKMKNKKKVIG